MKIDLELALLDFAAAYELDAEGALYGLQALLLDTAACRARLEILQAVQEAVEIARWPGVRQPPAHLPDTLVRVREYGLFRALAERRVTVDQLAELSLDAQAIGHLHRFYQGEDAMDQNGPRETVIGAARRTTWLSGWQLLYALAGTLLLCLFCGAVAYSDLWSKFAELRTRLGLNTFVRFVLEDPQHPSTDPDRAAPLVVMDGQVRARGTVNPSLVQAIEVEATRLTGPPAGPPQQKLHRIVEPGPDEELPVPFDIPLELPLDDQIWQVRLRLIPHQRPGDLARELVEKTYTRYVKCQPFGPAVLPLVPGGRPIPGFLEHVEVAFYWSPGGFFGDTGDIRLELRQGQVAHFVYEPLGRGFHTSDQENSTEALGMAGCCWLAPADNWGTDASGGVDLRDFQPRRLTWEARSLGPRPPLVFFWGIASPEWTGEAGRPRGGPLDPRDSLGLYNLNLDATAAQDLSADWQTFVSEPFEFRPHDERLKRVVCGFAWKIDHRAAQVSANTVPDSPPRYEFEIRRVRFLK